jgi:hypothetical protein
LRFRNAGFDTLNRRTFANARNRHYRRLEAEEARDDDGDGVPDLFERSEQDG